MEWSVFLDKIKKHEFEALMGAWVLTDYPPDQYQIFHSSQSKMTAAIMAATATKPQTPDAGIPR